MEFVRYISELNLQWKALLQTRGVPQVTKMLERLFGEELAKVVIEKQTRDMEAYRARRALGMRTGSGIITGAVGSSVLRLRPHTFYGQEK
jgi:hypothetical protein